jgi:alcohol dehydrogenase
MIRRSLKAFDFQPAIRIVFGDGTLDRLGGLAASLGFTRTLLVADPGIVAIGCVDRAAQLLSAAGVEVVPFHAFDANPDTRMVEAGRAAAAAAGIDSLVALGGGSSLDCAKGINFVLSGGGSMGDYRGFGRARGAMLPSIGIPTTAGTGSEAQSYAIISDAETHVKMACGDPRAAFRVAILDPVLTVSQPRPVSAVAGYDAMAHAVESYVTVKRTAISDLFAREAWRLLAGSYERMLDAPADLALRGAMLLGAHYAGIAIEQSMLGATHACANPLTARYGTTHGIAIAVMLPHVVRWNSEAVGDRYADLLWLAGDTADPDIRSVRLEADRRRGPAEAGHYVPDVSDMTRVSAGHQLAELLSRSAGVGGLPATLRDIGASRDDLKALAADAATQWTGTFNPRPFDAAAALSLYERAY